MKTFLVEEVGIVEQGDTIFPDLKQEVITSTRVEHVYRSGAIDTIERAEEWADFRVRVTMQEDRTRQEIRISEYEFDDETGKVISRRIRKQFFLPLTYDEIVDNVESLEAIIVGDEWHYVCGHYTQDDEDDINYGKEVLCLGYYDDGYMNENDVDVDDLTGRNDVRLVTGCAVKVGTFGKSYLNVTGNPKVGV